MATKKVLIGLVIVERIIPANRRAHPLFSTLAGFHDYE